VEKLTGINYFPALPEKQEQKIEKHLTPDPSPLEEGRKDRASEGELRSNKVSVGDGHSNKVSEAEKRIAKV